MTDADVLERVDQVNVFRGTAEDLERKKKLIQQEVKSVTTEMDQMFENISRREEPREVECEVSYNYDMKMVDTSFNGEIMESRKMTDWEYSSRPEDIYPQMKKSKVTGQPDIKSGETPLEAALNRADEIAEKEGNMVAKSENTKAFSEAKTETSTIITAETLG